MPRKILVASYSSQITTLSFNALPPSLSVVSTLEAGYHPSWIAPHTIDRSLVFTVNEQANGAVKALKYDLKTGQGTIVGEASSGGADPCHVTVLGNEVIVGNYSGGTVGFLPLSASPPYMPPKPVQVLSFPGSGPVASRQESSHPHQVVPHPTRSEVLIPDLGTDKVWRLSRSGGRWEVKGHVTMPPGGGPRHAVVFGETLYTLLELSNALISHIFPAPPAPPIAVKTLPTLYNPPKTPVDSEHPALNAEILSPPTSAAFPTQYLYVTNRNDPRPEGDILAIFEAGKAGGFSLVAEICTGLRHLRGIAFDEEGKYLIAGGALGGGVKVFERVDRGKHLKEVAHLREIEKPTGFHWLPKP